MLPDPQQTADHCLGRHCKHARFPDTNNVQRQISYGNNSILVQFNLRQQSANVSFSVHFDSRH